MAGVTLALGGCGGTDDSETAAPRAASSAELRDQLQGATSSQAADFPAVNGRSLQDVADGIGAAGPEYAPAGSIYTPGRNRLAFGIIDPTTGFVYGPTAVYLAESPQAVARGPFPAPADLLVTDPPFRSEQAAAESDPFAAIYSAEVDLPRPGRVAVLAVTKVKDQLVASNGELKVIRPERDQMPAVGEPAPRVSTDTTGDVASIEEIDTRQPPDDLHDVDLKEALGRKPVAVLFATPQLCHSRVCGPVVDIALQLRERYGDRMEFIHQEVYVDNAVDRGLRPPLARFGLTSEPWLFVMNRQGIVTSRLEGSFGFTAMERAIRTGL